MSLPNGASFYPGEIERVQAALDALAKDPHAEREISVRVIVHVHNEYPKLLYKGAGTRDTVSVLDEAAENAAVAAGYGPHSPETGE